MKLHILFVFFFNDTATTEIYTLSLHDALPISQVGKWFWSAPRPRVIISKETYHYFIEGVTGTGMSSFPSGHTTTDRKSTRLNSSHANISYAVFCLKKKNYTS